MEVLFRDGLRNVPNHVAALLEPVDTYKLTYKEALDVINKNMVSNHLDKTFGKIVSQHFENWRGR